MKQIGMALIGLGQISHAHEAGYRAAAEHVSIVAVCDVQADVAQARATSLHCSAYTDYTSLLADPAVDAVDITLPHNLHYAVAKAALEHGKHVLIEKPMAGTSAQCRELIDLAGSRGVSFTVAENTRFVRAYIEAKKLLDSGELGTPRLIRTFIYGSEITRLSDTTLWKGRRDGTLGGAIYDAGPHTFYLLKWLCGEIECVQAVQHRLVSMSEVEDNAVVSGKMKNGSIFTTAYSFTAEIPWGERCEIYGSKGSLIIDQITNPPVLHYHGAMDYAGTAVDAVPFDPVRWKWDSIAAGARDFVVSIFEGRTPTIDPEDGLYTLLVAEKAYESIAAHGKAIAL